MTDRDTALLHEYQANVQLLINKNDLRQTSVTWYWVVQVALLGALGLFRDLEGMQVIACASGFLLSAVVLLLVARHIAYARFHEARLAQIEENLSAPATSTFRCVRYMFSGTDGERTKLGKLLRSLWPKGRTCGNVSVTWLSRYSNNRSLQAMILIIGLAWIALLLCLVFGPLDISSQNGTAELAVTVHGS